MVNLNLIPHVVEELSKMNSYDRIYSLLIEGRTSGGNVKATGERVGRAMSQGRGDVRKAVNIAGRLIKRHSGGDEQKEKKIRQDYFDAIKRGASLSHRITPNIYKPGVLKGRK